MSAGRVLAFGMWDRGDGYPRTETLFSALRSAGYVVDECRVEPPFAGQSKLQLLKAPWRWPAYWLAMRRLRREAKLRLRAYLAGCTPEIVLVPYPGNLAVRWAREEFAGPVVLDMFLSAFDTAVADRRLFGPRSLPAKLLRRLDRRAALVADRVLFDTAANADHLARVLDVPFERCAVVPVSATQEADPMPPYEGPRSGYRLQLLFFGTGVPLHGLDSLIHAVARCPGVHLTLIGGTPADRALAQATLRDRLTLRDPFLSRAELQDELAKAHLVAGVFGTTNKADRVVPLKVVGALAAGRPVITGHTRAVAATLRVGEECVTVPCGQPIELAAALQMLATDPARLRLLAARARQAYEREFAQSRVAACLTEIILEVAATMEHAVPPHAALAPVLTPTVESVT